MLISPLLIIMNNFLPLFSLEQFKQLPEVVQLDFTLNYKKLSGFVVQSDLCKRYNENELAVLTEEEIKWLTLIIKERTLSITSKIPPLYNNVNPETLLLGNTLFEKISNQLIINSESLSVNQFKHPTLENYAQLTEVNASQETKKPQTKTGRVQIIRNRIKDLDFKTNSISKKSTSQAVRLQSPQTKTNTKKDEVFFNPLPTKHNFINSSNSCYSEEETPEVISEIEENIENISHTEKLINSNSDLQNSNSGIVTPEVISEEESLDFLSDIEETLANNTPAKTFMNEGSNLKNFDAGSLKSSDEKKGPDLFSVVKEPCLTSTSNNPKFPREAIIFDESLIITATPFTKTKVKPTNGESSVNTLNKQNIESYCNRVKKDLGIIHKNFQKESGLEDQFIYDTNSYSFKAEENAIKSLQKIYPRGRASTYYFSQSSMAKSLKGVVIELEFFNAYLIDESMYKDQIAILEKCQEACSTILTSDIQKSEHLKDEARDLNDSIKKYYLPITHFNFAVYNFKKINNKVLVANKNELLANLDELIGDLEKSITYLKNASNLLKNSKREAELNIIINFLAKSYEDLADFKSNKVDLMLKQNQNDDSLLNLLKEIKINYQESNSLINDHLIWLSILYSQHKLIEAYTDNKNKDLVKEGLNETINLMDGLIKKGLSASEEPSTNLELLYYMMYACSKAYSLTNPASNEFQQKALKFIKLHIELITTIDSDCDQENLSAEIINSLVQLKLINEDVRWDLHSAINEACFSQNDNQTADISISYVKKVSENKEKTTLTIKYKDLANSHNNKKELPDSGSRSGFFQRAKSQPNSQSDLNSTKSFL